MDCLGVWLRRGRSPMRYIDVNAEWPLDIHTNQTGRRFQADYYYKTGPSASLTPLEIQMLSFSSDLEWFAMCAMDSSLELPQGPPDGKPEASH